LISLRPYQTDSIEAVRAAIRRGKRRIMLTIPTGGGKTLTAASVMIAALGKRKRCLFVAHRLELIDQTVATFARLGITSVGVIRASDRRHDTSQPIQVASIQTLARRKQGEFDLVFVDEAHRSNAATYTKHVFERHAGAVLIGLSATPCRADGRPLGTHFDELIVGARYSELIAEGHIVAPLVYSTPVLPDMSTVRTSGGDYNQEDLERAVNNGALIGDIIAQWHKHPRQRTVVFAVSVAHSKAIVAMFRDANVRAEHLDGTTPEDERRAILRRLESGETELVSNVGVLCLDEQTQILTDAGWVGIDNMTTKHRVANWDAGGVTFEEPFEVIRRNREYGERMVSVNGERLDVRVTEGHGMLYRTTESGQFLKAPARDIVDRVCRLPVSGVAAPSCVRPVQRPTMSASRRALLITKTAYNVKALEGWPASTSRAEAVRRVDRRAALGHKNHSDLSLDDCRLIGFWTGDGCRCALQSGGVEYVLAQSYAYPKIIAWVDALISRLGIHVIAKDVAPAAKTTHKSKRWSMPRGTGGGRQQRAGLFYIEPYLEKSGSPLLWGLDVEQFGAFIEGFWMADGDHGDGTPKPTSRSMTIHNTNVALLDLLQAIAVVRGYGCTLGRASAPKQAHHLPCFRLRLRKKKTFHIGWDTFQLEQGWKHERVWCVRTRTKNIITRRGGKVLVMGNCEGWDMPSCKTLILARPTKSLGLYMQMAGRTLRPWQGVDSLILDHGGNVDRHGLPHEDREWSLSKKAKKGSGAPPVKACPACFAFVAACARCCPHCGHAWPVTVPEAKDVEPVIVDLALRTLDGDDAKLSFFRSLHRQCRDRGWKYGAVIHRYEARFSEPPAPAWIAALKADFRRDPEWKGRIKIRQADVAV